MKIPAGVDTGTRIQLAGQGEVGPGGGPPGDLYVEIVERPHADFTRRGDDLHCTLEVPMTAAALGTTRRRSTRSTASRRSTSGPAPSPARSQTLRGLGVTHLRGTGRGDLVVHSRRADARPGWTSEQERAAARAGPAARRGAARPAGWRPAHQGVFSKLRDAFAGR